MEGNSASKNTVYVRNYPEVTADNSGKCLLDGANTGDHSTYYKLNMTVDGKGVKVYSGVLYCTDDACTTGCTAVDSLAEQVCQPGAFGLKFLAASDLNKCASDGRAAPFLPSLPRLRRSHSPAATSTKIPGTTESPDETADPQLVGGLVGGGIFVAVLVFGGALLYRRYEVRARRLHPSASPLTHRSPQARHSGAAVGYTSIPTGSRDYGTVPAARPPSSYEDEGMTTDI